MAGGACRAAVVALASAGAAWIGIANRHRNRAQKMLEEFGPRFTGTAFAEYSLDSGLLSKLHDSADILVNTTAVGLKGEIFEFDVLSCVADAGGVYDMVYGPG